jgi:alpha-glucosidase
VTTLLSRTTHASQQHSAPWWRHAVIYQVSRRSFADSDGDGVGDLPGIASRLPYLAGLGWTRCGSAPSTSPHARRGVWLG